MAEKILLRDLLKLLLVNYFLRKFSNNLESRLSDVEVMTLFQVIECRKYCSKFRAEHIGYFLKRMELISHAQFFESYNSAFI